MDDDEVTHRRFVLRRLLQENREMVHEMVLDDIANEAYQTAKDRGWFDLSKGPVASFGESIAMIHSELSEALEEYRKGYSPGEEWLVDGNKPMGVPSELADVLIRTLNLARSENVMIGRAVVQKMLYNITRSTRHGGKRF